MPRAQRAARCTPPPPQHQPPAEHWACAGPEVREERVPDRPHVSPPRGHCDHPLTSLPAGTRQEHQRSQEGARAQGQSRTHRTSQWISGGRNRELKGRAPTGASPPPPAALGNALSSREATVRAAHGLTQPGLSGAPGAGATGTLYSGAQRPSGETQGIKGIRRTGSPAQRGEGGKGRGTGRGGRGRVQTAVQMWRHAAKCWAHCASGLREAL